MSFSLVEGDLEPDMLLTVVTATDYDLADAIDVQLRWKTPDGEIVMVDLVEVSTNMDTGVYKYVWQAGGTDQVGAHSGQIVITWDVGVAPEVVEENETCPNDGSWAIWYVYSAS